MALTEDDIETAIEQSENQDAVRHLISNCFGNLSEPVSVEISLSTDYLSRQLLNREDIQNIVNVLRERGVEAVSVADAESILPSKFIVNDKCIQTPFLSPDDALKVTIIIADVVCTQENIVLSGQANLLFGKSLLYTIDKKMRSGNDKGLNIIAENPHADKIPEILAKYGEDMETFIDRKINEVVENSVTINISAEQKRSAQNGYDTVWRGTTLMGKPYAAVASENTGTVARASFDIAKSLEYTGYGKQSADTRGAWYPQTKSGQYYGCLFKYKSSGNEQICYSGGETDDSYGLNIENDEIKLGSDTIVYPHKNEFEAMYIQVGPTQFYPVPTDKDGNVLDNEWCAFVKLHEPSDDTLFGYEAVRRDAQKREQDSNPQHCYDLNLQMDLEPKKYDCKYFSAAEIANVFAYRGSISRDGTGHIDINQSIKIDLNPNNADLKDITVYGECTLNNIGKTSIFNMPNIRETETGLSTKINLIGAGILTDVDKVSTHDLLKIVGGWRKDADYASSTISVNQNIELDALPNDFNSRKYDHVSIRCTVDGVENFPDTLHGCSYIKVRNQTSIEDMSPDEFKSKIMGSLGSDKSVEADYSLDLTTTNITILPKAMRDETFDSVRMNPSYKILSLDNFPKTEDGISGINFEGSLSNLTTEEFLLKVKGKKWCENNISKDDTGIVSVKNFSLRENKFKITEYPKDIIICRFEKCADSPQTSKEWNNVSDKAKLSEIINQPKVILREEDKYLFNNIPELNLSSCKAVKLSDIDLSGIKIVFPNNGIIEIGENVKFAPDILLDLSNCAAGIIHPSVQCGEIKLPKILLDRVRVITLPPCVTEISTTCIAGSRNIERFNIPSHVEIIDTPDENGKKIDLKMLEARGLTKEQISKLLKDRIEGVVFGVFNKVLPEKYKLKKSPVKKAIPVRRRVAPKYSSLSDDAKKAIMNKMGIKSGVADKAVTTGDTSIQSLYQNREKSIVQPHKITQAHQLSSKTGMKVDEFVDILRHGRNTLIGADYRNATEEEVAEADISQNTEQSPINEEQSNNEN